MTENILYNRIDCLANRNEDERDFYFELVCKLLHIEPRGLKSKEQEKNLEYLVNSLVDMSPRAILSYCTYLSGGMYREQFNYLGLYVIKEKDNIRSYTRTRISEANKFYSSVVGNNIIDRYENRDNESTFYYANEHAPAALSSSLTLNGQKAFIEVPSLISTHKPNLEHITSPKSYKQPNLEHASGINDYWAYIMGNRNYPTMFNLENEVVCTYGEGGTKYFIADGKCSTILQNKDMVNGEVVLAPHTYIDYIETDTGSQKPNDIATKLSNYFDFILSSIGLTEKDLKPLSRELNNLDRLNEVVNTLAYSSLIFLNHPNNMCGSTKGYTVDVATDKEKVRRICKKDDALMNLYSIISWVPLLNECKFDTLKHKIRSLNKDGLKLLFGESLLASNKDSIESINSTYNNILRAVDELDAYICDNSDTNSNQTVFDLYKIISESDDEDTAESGYSRKHAALQSNYLNRRNVVLYKAFKALYNNKDRQKAGMLKTLCRFGFSIANIFGGDMYRTYLGMRPQFTGAYKWLVQLLVDNGILPKEDVSKFTRLDELNVTHVKAYKLYAYDKVDNFVIRNYFPTTDVDGKVLDLFFEDISIDYGAQIRCSSAFYLANKHKLDNKTLMVMLVDNFAEAYKFVVRYATTLIDNASVIKDNNLEYAFLLKSDFLNYISGMAAGKDRNIKLYGISDFDYYRYRYDLYEDGGSDEDFKEVFASAISKEKNGKIYEKDFSCIFV